MNDDTSKNYPTHILHFLGIGLPLALLVIVPPCWATVIRHMGDNAVESDQLLYELLPAWLMPLCAFLCFC